MMIYLFQSIYTLDRTREQRKRSENKRVKRYGCHDSRERERENWECVFKQSDR